MSFDIPKFKEKVLTIDSIGLMYILVVGGLCHILSIPEMVKGFLALPGFLIIPYLVGKTIYIPIKKLLKIEFNNFDSFLNFTLYWCIGAVSIVVIAYFLNYFWLFDAKIYAFLLIFLMCISVMFYHKKKYGDMLNLKKSIKKYGGISTILLSILIGTIAFLVVNSFTPYPYEAGGDSIDHNYYSMQIYKENFFYFLAPYSLFIHLLSALNIQIFNMYNEPYILWWLGRFILYIFYSLGLYLFSYELSKNKIVATIAVFVGIFVVHPYTASSLLNDFSPKAFILVLFPYLLLLTHQLLIQKRNENINNKQILFFITLSFGFLGLSLYFTYASTFALVDSIGIILVFFIIFGLTLMRYVFKPHIELLFSLWTILFVLLLIHIPMGAMGFLFILLYFALVISMKRHPKITSMLLYSTIIFTLSFFILQTIGIIKFPSILFSFYNILNPAIDGFQNMSNHIMIIYGSLALCSFLIVSSIIIFHKKKEYFPVLFLTSIILIFLFAPIGSVWRLWVFLNPLMAFLIAYGLIKVVNLISKKRKNSSIFIGLLFISLFLMTVVNMMNEINNVVSEQGVFSPIGEYMYSAGYFLKENTPKNTLLLQYKTSDIIMRIGYYSERLTYSSTSATAQPPECVKNIFTAQNPKESYDKVQDLLKNNDSDCEWYIGGMSQYQYDHRYNKAKQLINNRRSKNISIVIIFDKGTLDVIPPNAINKFYNLTYFTPLYKDAKNQIYIFGVNPEPGVPFKVINNSK